MQEAHNEDANSTFDFADWGFRPPLRYASRTTAKPTVKHLLDHGLLRPHAVLRPARKATLGSAVVDASGKIVVNGIAYKTPSGAAKAASRRNAESGWHFWLVQDEGVSLAELRIRLRALDRSRRPIAERFEASIGNGLEGYYGVEADGERLIWQFRRGDEIIERDEFAPAAEEWIKFWDALDRAGIWRWKASYEAEGVLDGTYWDLVAERDGQRIESSGTNGYPESAGSDPTRAFTTFCRAVSTLSRHAFR